MNCKGCIREISNYIDGDLDVAMKKEIDRHLADCEECMMIFSQTKLTVEIFCDSQPIELSSEVRTRLHDALRRKIHGPSNP